MHRHNWQPEIPSYDLPSQEMDSTSPSSGETLSEVEQMPDHLVIDQQLTASYNPTQPLEQEITRTLSEGASCEDWQDSMETAASMDVHTGDQRIAMTYQRKRRSVKSMDPNDQSSDANPRPSQRRRNYTYMHPPTQHRDTPHELTHTHADSHQESSMESSGASLGDPWASLSSSHLTCDTD